MKVKRLERMALMMGLIGCGCANNTGQTDTNKDELVINGLEDRKT